MHQLYNWRILEWSTFLGFIIGLYGLISLWISSRPKININLDFPIIDTNDKMKYHKCQIVAIVSNSGGRGTKGIISIKTNQEFGFRDWRGIVNNSLSIMNYKNTNIPIYLKSGESKIISVGEIAYEENDLILMKDGGSKSFGDVDNLSFDILFKRRIIKNKVSFFGSKKRKFQGYYDILLPAQNKILSAGFNSKFLLPIIQDFSKELGIIDNASNILIEDEEQKLIRVLKENVRELRNKQNKELLNLVKNSVDSPIKVKEVLEDYMKVEEFCGRVNITTKPQYIRWKDSPYSYFDSDENYYVYDPGNKKLRSNPPLKFE